MRIYEVRDEQEISEDQTPPTETPVPEVNETSSYDVGYVYYDVDSNGTDEMIIMNMRICCRKLIIKNFFRRQSL